MQKIIITLFFLIANAIVIGQELPPIQNYGIADYEAGNQNWSITQTPDHYIYFGNNNGLLEFNGASWKLYPSSNGTIIRAVHAVDEIIYTGCYMEFGFWERNEFGDLGYTSLLNKLDQALIEDEHFWNITAHDEWVLFQSLNRIYLYNTSDGSIEIVEFDTSHAKIFNLGTKIFIQKESEGLFSIQNGKVVLVSDHQVFKDNFIVGIFNHSKQLLVITEKGKFYFLNDNELSEWKIDAFKSNADINLYSSLQLKNGGIILGAISKGYIQLSKSGDLVQRVDQEKGLSNNTVLSTFQDVDGNLWLGLDNGISLVNLESEYKVYRDAKGKLGSVYASAVFQEHLYLGTNQGLFYRKLISDDDFQLVKNTSGQVWNLQNIDNTLFCSHTKGTFVIDGKEAEHIYDASGTWSIIKIEGGDNLLIQGNYTGLNILNKKEGSWVFRNKIEGFDISSKSMAFLNDQEIVINHEFKGIFKLKIDKEFKRIVETENVAPVGFDSNISTYNNAILFTSSEGIFKLKGDTLELERQDFLSNVFYDEDDRIRGKLIMEEDGSKIWGFSEKNIICMMTDHFDGSPKAIKVAIPSFFRKNQGLTGFENMSKLTEENYLIGTSNGYTILDMEKLVDKDYIVKIVSVEKIFQNADDVRVPFVENQVFNYSENNLRFLFSVPEFDKYTEVAYQYQLKGLHDGWSKWFNTPNFAFGNLNFGDYTLLVRAKVGNKLSKNMAFYSFRISKPWYLSIPALVLYFIGTVMLMWGIHKGYKQNYKKQKQRLMEENRRKIEHSQLESEQEIVKLKNQQLKKDIDAKNNELAGAAMSLINKNELLNGIKNDLLHLEDKSSRDEVARVIDKNLKNNSDWEFFQKSFNDADKDFLTKIKAIHPGLTANDLKFCTFLRLNLASKEIAPLLNISVRSVEIKRYRLRKKLGISHEINLIDYILEV